MNDRDIPQGELRVGLDVGSTTAKLIVLGPDDRIAFSIYRRHSADIANTLVAMLDEAMRALGNRSVTITATGSAGMGVAERAGLPFVQEVVAAGDVVQKYFPDVQTLIDIGGEDSKMMFFDSARPPDIRMNGSCAGGTGAFIDQMAALMDFSLGELNAAAQEHTEIYPIASRCGVFAKTDVQNLISRKIDTSNICASILHAVAVQNLNSLARGVDVRERVLFCGGPLTFLPALRDRFQECLKLSRDDIILPENSEFFPAWGASLQTPEDTTADTLDNWRKRMQCLTHGHDITSHRLDALFENEDRRAQWESERATMHIPTVDLEHAEQPLFLGVDSGSTTTKVLVLDSRERVVFHDYRPNLGKPVDAAVAAMLKFRQQLKKCTNEATIATGAVTGYGEDLIQAALDLDHGMVETLAHWRAAAQCDPDVSFILDIGGQDMKAIFVRDQSIRRIEINEACSSGCGSFIEGFAQSLGLSAAQFAERACNAHAPCDLGTRCTVFMNSRIKQAQRENAEIEDIAAGLAYAVVKNSLYKVLKLRDSSELGDHIVVQGGTFRNHAVLRALEVLSGTRVASSNWPEMMGAYGAALLAKESHESDPAASSRVDLVAIDSRNRFTSKQTQCRGCTNRCTVTTFSFDSGRKYFTGNKCERIFSNRGHDRVRGRNFFTKKNALLFDRPLKAEGEPMRLRIGIPRVLIMYEEFPFWSKLLTTCGFDVVLSGESNDAIYDKGLGTIMADNICFPAKLAHGHVIDLADKDVDRIFYPQVVHEVKEQSEAVNSYNCPIVTGYAEVLSESIRADGRRPVPFDSPAISFRDEKLLKKACFKYVKSLGVCRRRFEKAYAAAVDAQKEYRDAVHRQGVELLESARSEGRTVIVLAGRPYHVDPLIEHQTSGILADLGADVLPVDVAASETQNATLGDLVTIPQWTFPNRLLKAAQWVASVDDPRFQFVMLNSFGCGPDAFIMDEIRDVLSQAGKIFTLIKIDEISSSGSVRLRLRSLLEALKWRPESYDPTVPASRTTPPYQLEDRRKKIIVPFMSEYYSPFAAPLFTVLGYDLEVMPAADEASVECGMKYANNEVCYPAIVVIGDLIKHLKSGKYDSENIAVALTQTGGQCRATNYVSVLKRALVAAGFTNVPVIAVGGSDNIINDQPGFKIDFRKIIRPAIAGLLYGDAIARLYYRTVVRERTVGLARTLRDHYMSAVTSCAERCDALGMVDLLRDAVRDFNDAVADTSERPRVGIVGEIFLKYNGFSHMHVVDWLISQGIEPSVPPLMDFFTQYFVNAKVNRSEHITKLNSLIIFEWLSDKYTARWIDRFESVMEDFVCYKRPATIFEKGDYASEVIKLTNQYGEAWLIAGEIAGFAHEGINDIVCLQPFGCIANHVVAKGIERKIKRLYPKTNLLFLDFDASTSEVNVLNRLHFMVGNARDLQANHVKT